MGRQRFITNLALGRSPYEAPELTADGQFIYNRAAAHLLREADSYHQQFDDRGRPVNPDQRRAERRVTRAQNDVNSTFGIVVSREQDQKDREEQERQKKDDEEFQQEDEAGIVMQILDVVLLFQFQWSVMTLRNRYQVFQMSPGVSIIQAFQLESKQVGTIRMLCGGLPTFWLFKVVQISREMFCDHLIELLAESDSRLKGLGRYLVKAVNLTSRLLVDCPLQQFSMLQALHLVSPLGVPYFSSWFPLSASSQVSWVVLPPLTTTRAFAHGFMELINHPLVLQYIYNTLSETIIPYIDELIEDHLLAHPEPPRITLVDKPAGSTKSANTDSAGQQPTVLGAVNLEIQKFCSTIISLFNSIPLSWSSCSPSQSDSLRRRSFSTLSPDELVAITNRSAAYQDEALASAAGYNHAQRRELRLEAHRRAFDEAGIVPPDYVTEEMIETRSEDDDDSEEGGDGEESTATPDEAEFDEAIFGPVGRRTESPERYFDLEDTRTRDRDRSSQLLSTNPNSASQQRTSRMHEILDNPTDSNARPQPQTTQSQPPQPSSSTAQTSSTHPQSNTARDRGSSWSWSSLIPSRAPSLYPPPPHSPATTPPTSPLLRASLVHHDSETVTMQLEVIQPQATSSSSSNPRSSSLAGPIIAVSGGDPIRTRIDDDSSTEETLLAVLSDHPRDAEEIFSRLDRDVGTGSGVDVEAVRVLESVRRRLAERAVEQGEGRGRNLQDQSQSPSQTTQGSQPGAAGDEAEQATQAVDPTGGNNIISGSNDNSWPAVLSSPSQLPQPLTSTTRATTRRTSSPPRLSPLPPTIPEHPLASFSSESRPILSPSSNPLILDSPSDPAASLRPNLDRTPNRTRNQNSNTNTNTTTDPNNHNTTTNNVNSNPGNPDITATQQHQQQHQRRPSSTPSFPSSTSLASFPSTSLTHNLAKVLTAFILLPMEAQFLRSLARTFLVNHNPIPSTAGTLGLGGTGVGIRGLGLRGWFGGPGIGVGTGTGMVMGMGMAIGMGWREKMEYAARMVALVGVQGLIGLGVWAVEVAVVEGLGRGFWGWGPSGAV